MLEFWGLGFRWSLGRQARTLCTHTHGTKVFWQASSGVRRRLRVQESLWQEYTYGNKATFAQTVRARHEVAGSKSVAHLHGVHFEQLSEVLCFPT